LTDISVDKIVVLKDTKYANISNQAGYQIEFSFFSGCLFNEYPSEKINNDREAQNQNIHWHKGHVEIATANQ
jgi:hypothetical protein